MNSIVRSRNGKRWAGVKWLKRNQYRHKRNRQPSAAYQPERNINNGGENENVKANQWRKSASNGGSRNQWRSGMAGSWRKHGVANMKHRRGGVAKQ
jgi:hypothetical protein